MHINTLFNKGKVQQGLTLNGRYIFVPKKNGGRKVCRNVRELRKLFDSEKDMFEFLQNNNVDICVYME